MSHDAVKDATAASRNAAYVGLWSLIRREDALMMSLRSLAPKAGQDKAGRSDFPHFAVQTAQAKTRKIWIISPPHRKEGSEKVCGPNTRKTQKIRKMWTAKTRKMRMTGLKMTGLSQRKFLRVKGGFQASQTKG